MKGGLIKEIQQEEHSDVSRRSAQGTACTVGIEIRKTIDDKEPKANRGQRTSVAKGVDLQRRPGFT